MLVAVFLWYFVQFSVIGWYLLLQGLTAVGLIVSLIMKGTARCCVCSFEKASSIVFNPISYSNSINAPNNRHDLVHHHYFQFYLRKTPPSLYEHFSLEIFAQRGFDNVFFAKQQLYFGRRFLTPLLNLKNM